MGTLLRTFVSEYVTIHRRKLIRSVSRLMRRTNPPAACTMRVKPLILHTTMIVSAELHRETIFRRNNTCIFTTQIKIKDNIGHLNSSNTPLTVLNRLTWKSSKQFVLTLCYFVDSNGINVSAKITQKVSGTTCNRSSKLVKNYLWILTTEHVELLFPYGLNFNGITPFARKSEKDSMWCRFQERITSTVNFVGNKKHPD